jgi:formamidopyrimidine-DNA glycosylase
MPEGHTLHRLATDLTAAFAGRRVRVSSPQGRFAADAATLDGATVVGAESAGKHLFVEFDAERYVHVHLGLIGSFDVRSGPAPAPVRPDADPDRAWQRIRRSSRPIGDLLLDQAVLAGVGNVYRAEVLFRQRIHPQRPGSTLRVSQWRAIWEDLVELMAEGVRLGRIDTVRPEHTPEAMGRPPRADDHGGEVYVYRRTGQPCLVCGRPVRTEVLAGRNSFWCARCQPRFRSRAVQ